MEQRCRHVCMCSWGEKGTAIKNGVRAWHAHTCTVRQVLKLCCVILRMHICGASSVSDKESW